VALRVFQIVAAVNGIGLAVYDNAIGAILQPLNVLAGAAILLAIAVIRSCRGDRAAQVFLAANGVMCLFGINVAITFLGWVPDTPIGRNGALLGSALEIALLSFALAWRLKHQERMHSLLEEQSDALVHRVQELKAASSLAEHHRKLQRAVQHQQKLKTIGEMAGGVAHDFNNILAAILGYAELALEKNALTNPDKRTRYVEEIHKAGKRGADLVRQLITYSRGEQKTAEEIDLHLAVEETVTLLRASLPATVTIETHFPQQRIRTVLDPSQLQQVLVNLSLNACEAMTNRGKIKLTLSERHVDSLQCSSCLQRFSGRFAYICLEDDGVGIQCQAHELFTPFRTTKPVGQGSGLGLSVVHGIVHDYGGHVHIGNRTRGGCRAAIFLPLDPENVNKEISAQRILLIEEDASAAVHMETLLQAQAYAVTAVHQPAEALEKLLADPDGYDLVITNRSLPAGGMDFARELLDLCPDLPIIVTTGNPEDLEEAEETPMTAIMGKPIESDLLLAEVRHLLEPV
jgi:signal transduction histidine kinase